MVLKLEDKIKYVEREIEETVGRTTAWSGGATAFGSCEDLLIETLYENSNKQDDMSFEAACDSYKNHRIRERLCIDDALFFYEIRTCLYHSYELLKQHDETAIDQGMSRLPADISVECAEVVKRYLEAAKRGVASQNPTTEAPSWYASYVREFTDMLSAR